MNRARARALRPAFARLCQALKPILYTKVINASRSRSHVVRWGLAGVEPSAPVLRVWFRRVLRGHQPALEKHNTSNQPDNWAVGYQCCYQCCKLIRAYQPLTTRQSEVRPSASGGRREGGACHNRRFHFSLFAFLLFCTGS